MHPHRTPRRALKVFAVVLSAVVLLTTSAAYGLWLYSWSAIEKLDVFAEGHATSGEGGTVNYLLVGSDSGEGLTKEQLRQFSLGARRATLGQRSDTMLLVHISPKREKALVISFPRDSYVEIPNCTDSQGKVHQAHHNKLNASYSIGGARCAIRTIEHNTGVPIHHYVQVNVLGVANIVDAIGGVNVCVPRDVNDWRSGLNMTAGRHRVDGVTAVAYARNRTLTPDADLGRIQRQQALLGSLINEVTSTKLLFQPHKLLDFVQATTKAVKIDKSLTQDDILELAERFKSLDPRHVTFMTVPLARPSVNHGIGSTVDWDPVKSKKLFGDIKTDRALAKPVKQPRVEIAPSRISIAVKNGTDTDGLAKQAADELRAVGFTIRGTPSNASSPVAGTVVRFGPNRAESAATVKAAVPGAQLEQVTELGDKLELVLGPNYQGTQEVRVRAPSSANQTRTAADDPCS